jgi:hypothetical protein
LALKLFNLQFLFTAELENLAILFKIWVLTPDLIWLLWCMGVPVIIRKSLVVLVLPVALLNLFDVALFSELTLLELIWLCRFVWNITGFFLSKNVIKDTLVVSTGLHTHPLEGISTH